MIDVTYRKLDDVYGNMNAAKLAAMTQAERGEYYQSLYQYVGYLIGILHAPTANDGDVDAYPTLGRAEYAVLSAASNAHLTMLDALSALVDLTEE